MGNVRMQVDQADPSGKMVFEAKGLSHAFARATNRQVVGPVVKDLSLRVMRGDRIGLIGPNGAGKTTLLRLLLGEMTPQAGEVRRGANVQVAYYDQQREQLDPDRTVVDTVGDGADTVTVNGVPKHVHGYLADFLFSPERARSPVRALSGGERNRLLLARLFTRPANVLVLDEPTNDLDLETLELLEAQLVEWPGTLLLVSHDRRFLDNVVTSTLAFEGNGKVQEYVGGYEDWLRQSKLPVAKPGVAKRPSGVAKQSSGATKNRRAPSPKPAKPQAGQGEAVVQGREGIRRPAEADRRARGRAEAVAGDDGAARVLQGRRRRDQEDDGARGGDRGRSCWPPWSGGTCSTRSPGSRRPAQPGVSWAQMQDRRWSWARGPGLAVILFLMVTAAGTAGYMLIEGWSAWDSFYMTMISVTTVGYREVAPAVDARAGVDGHRAAGRRVDAVLHGLHRDGGNRRRHVPSPLCRPPVEPHA